MQAGTLIREGFHIYFPHIVDTGNLANAECYEQFIEDLDNVRIGEGCP